MTKPQTPAGPFPAVRAVPGRRQIRDAAGLVLGLLLAVVLAGCGSSGSNNGVATPNSGIAATTGSATPGQGDARKLAQCMRENGVPNFPDPAADGSFQGGGGSGIDPNSPEVKAAQEKCRQYLPNAGQPPQLTAEQSEQLRKFAKCMRENGLPDFPDPNSEGGISIDPSSGIDPMSAVFRAAQEKCQLYMTRPDATASNGSN